MLTIDELNKMQSAVQEYQKSVRNLEKFEKLNEIIFYFDGEMTCSAHKGANSLEAVKKALVEHYQKEVDIKQALLYNIGVSVPKRK